MRKFTLKFLFAAVVVLVLGLTNGFAQKNDSKTKRPKNMGILTVRTSPVAYPVRVNDQVL